MHISVRWVLSQKVKNGENITKARLCARVLEVVKDFPTDSPCCSRISIRTIFALIVSNQWEIKSIDVKTAFLQRRQIEKTIYLCPPKEAKLSNIRKLQKCVYGLADTNMYW